MSERIHKQSNTDNPEPEAPEPIAPAEYKQGFDDILDDIDDILEENALSFVQGFVQKGGE